MSEHIPKLQALDQSLARWYERVTGTKGVHPLQRERLQHFFDLYAPIRDSLIASHAAFRDLPVRRVETFELAGREHIEQPCLRQLHEDIRYCLSLLEAERQNSAQAPDLRREGIFFAGQQFDAIQWVGGIVSEAKTRIYLIDGYVDGTVLKMLTAKQPGVEVSVLAKPKAATPAFQQAAQAFQAQYGGLTIKLSDAFHDRFLLVDEKDHYHLGASLNYLAQRAFMFSLIEESEVVAAITSKWSAEWALARPFV